MSSAARSPIPGRDGGGGPFLPPPLSNRPRNAGVRWRGGIWTLPRHRQEIAGGRPGVARFEWPRGHAGSGVVSRPVLL